MKRIAVAGLLVAWSAALGLTTASPASAASCTTKDVTVLVQFPDHTEVGCAHGDPDSGYDALRAAGFSYTLAQGAGAGAICQIGGYPGHQCSSMPSEDAYWAYFHAAPGGSWTYSTRGGGSYNPKPGTVDGWRFGGGGAPTGNAPTVSPVSTQSPTVVPTKKPTKAPIKKPAATATASATNTPSATPSTSTTPSATPSSTPSAASSEVSPAPTASSSPTAQAVRSSSGKPADSDSGGMSWLWGLVLLGVLAAAGAVVAVRRRG